MPSVHDTRIQYTLAHNQVHDLVRRIGAWFFFFPSLYLAPYSLPLQSHIDRWGSEHRGVGWPFQIENIFRKGKKRAKMRWHRRLRLPFSADVVSRKSWEIYHPGVKRQQFLYPLHEVKVVRSLTSTFTHARELDGMSWCWILILILILMLFSDIILDTGSTQVQQKVSRISHQIVCAYWFDR